MDDLTICKKIAEIEGLLTESAHGYDCCAFKLESLGVTNKYKKYSFIPYSPLTNDALCFRLMIKYGVNLIQHHPKKYAPSFSVDGLPAFYLTANKAICLAIIAAHE